MKTKFWVIIFILFGMMFHSQTYSGLIKPNVDLSSYVGECRASRNGDKNTSDNSRCSSQENLNIKIKDIVEAEAKYDYFSGTVLVAKNDSIVYKGAFGYANRDFNILNTLQTKFNIGSVTKTFTALAIMQFVEQGKIDVDNPISKYLPDCPIPEKNKITIHQLLTHTSGLYDYANSEVIFDMLYKRSINEMIPYVYGSGLLFNPGDSVSYSSGGYILLGSVIEKVSGMTYKQYLNEKIFKPAGMKNSDLLFAEDISPNKAEGYKQIDREKFINRKLLDFPTSSAGGIFTTVNDLFLYKKALFGFELLSRDYLKILLSVKTIEIPGAGRVAYAWWIDKVNGSQRIYHTGGTPGFSSSLDIYPDLGFTIIIVSNTWRGGTGLIGLRSQINSVITGDYSEVPDEYTYDLSKGIDNYFDGNYRSSITHLNKVIEGNLQSKRLAYYYSALARIQTNDDLNNAIEYLNKFIELSDHQGLVKSIASAWYWKGSVYEKLNNKTKAIESYEKSLELNPESESTSRKISVLKNN